MRRIMGGLSLYIILLFTFSFCSAQPAAAAICSNILRDQFIFEPNFGRRVLAFKGSSPQVFRLGAGGESTSFLVAEPLDIYVVKRFKKKMNSRIEHMKALRLAQSISFDLGAFKIVEILSEDPARVAFIPGQTLDRIFHDSSFPASLKTEIVDKYIKSIASFDAQWERRHHVRVEHLDMPPAELPAIGIHWEGEFDKYFYLQSSNTLIDARNLDLYLIDPF
jgi:hypothetical protein